MTIVFRVPAGGAERVGFAYSPAMEAVLSLHVLVEPKHHPVQHGWVRAMRKLSPALKREIEAFSYAVRSYFPEFLFPRPTGGLADFGSELAGLRTADPELVRRGGAAARAGIPTRCGNRTYAPCCGSVSRGKAIKRWPRCSWTTPAHSSKGS
jgi:hypothetical protein